MGNGVKKFNPEAMDNSASDAENDLNSNYGDEVVLPVAEWWDRWFMKAGHKRLGRILVRIARENKKRGRV